jgi:glycosyltransferase involved in cell wall biosynthesis
MLRPVAQLGQEWLREWDRRTARGVTHFIANSRFVADRIRRYYHRQASVIYPPVDVEYFTPGLSGQEDFFLVISRLVPYKRVDVAIKAFNELGLPLVIIGDGPEMVRLRELARPNISLIGEVSDEVLRDYYRRCRALVFPGEEDFGIVPVEAQACGRPVIAYNGGGVRETVIDGRTGLFFPQQSVGALVTAVRSFDPHAFEPRVIRRQAQRFARQSFERRIEQFVSHACDGTPSLRIPAATGGI